MANLRLTLLGPFQAFLEGSTITGFESNKVRALLAYLAAEAGRPARRAALADLLWPDWPEKSAMRNLTFALVDLRKNIADRQAEPPFLLINRDGLQLNPASQIQVDLWDFSRMVKTAAQDKGSRLAQIDQLKSAMDLYRGPLLEGFSLADSAPYEEWLAAARQQVNRQVVQALGDLAEACLDRGELEQGLDYARRRVELEPWLEEGHQQLMRLLALSGQRSTALAQFETCRKTLKDEFGVEPGAETAALFEQIRSGKLARKVAAPEPFYSPITHRGPKHNLPATLTRFFGREAEIVQVKQRLAEWRLVTLTGSGGVGKTRLGLAVAAELLDEFPDGVWFIELAPLSDPELVSQTLANILSLHEESGQPVLERLKDFLANRSVFLVLDNCEHLMEACSLLADSLLKVCSRLKIMATSREPLGVSGEAIYMVPSLPFPARGQAVTPETIDAFAAVRLFSDRARQVLPGYQVTAHNASAVASICQRLDGIPLAIELAAARMSVLSAEELNTRLDNVFRLLAGGSRAALPRQQTLRATIDWSYRLLSEGESLLLRRLSIFHGGWDMDGAEGVCAGTGLEAFDILELLANLVNKSMAIATPNPSGGTRYHMLETIRQYAREKLFDSGEMAAVQNRHLAHFVELAERIEPQGRGPNQKEWRRQLEDDFDNIRLALETGLSEDPPAGLRLVCAINGFWGVIGRHVEAVRWLRDYLDHPANAAHTALRGTALWMLNSKIQHPPGDENAAAQESLDIFRGLNDLTGQGCALWSWGRGAFLQEDYASARRHLEAALDIFEQLQIKWWMAVTQNLLSTIWANFKGGAAIRLAYLEKALALFRETGDQNRIASVLASFAAYAAFFQGDLRRASAMLVEALAIFRQSDLRGEAIALDFYQYTLCWQGEFERAHQVWDEILEIQRQSDDEFYLYVTNLNYGCFVSLQGRLVEGVARMEQAVIRMKALRSIYYEQSLLMELAYALACLGEMARAESLVAEFAHLFKDDQYQPKLMKLRGFLALQKGDAEAAVRYYRESLIKSIQWQFKLDAVLTLEGYAWALRLNGESVEAARLLGAAAEFRAHSGAQVFPRDRPFYDQAIAALKEKLGEEGYAAAWAEGQALGFDRARNLEIT